MQQFSGACRDRPKLSPPVRELSRTHAMEQGERRKHRRRRPVTGGADTTSAAQYHSVVGRAGIPWLIAVAFVLVAGLAGGAARAAVADEDQPNPVAGSPDRNDQPAARAPAPDHNGPPAWLAPPPPRDSDARPLPLRVTLGMLIGTGYGWVEGITDGGRSVGGGGWAGLGHLVPELGFIFPRAHLFLLGSYRYQKLTGRTDVHADGAVLPGRSSASAFLSKWGWFPRAPRAQVQPYLMLITGVGSIVHTVKVDTVATCGSNMNEPCSDAVNGGDIFFGGGTGVRVRLSEYFDAVAGVEGLAGAVWDGMINIDFNVGVAFVN
jgi:hypothetical protein